MKPWQSKACGPYGASMGRASDPWEAFRGKVRCECVPLDRGGYDPGGAYWGAVDFRAKCYPLFCFWDGEGAARFERHESRAKAIVAAKLPEGARFWRRK